MPAGGTEVILDEETDPGSRRYRGKERLPWLIGAVSFSILIGSAVEYFVWSVPWLWNLGSSSQGLAVKALVISPFGIWLSFHLFRLAATFDRAKLEKDGIMQPHGRIGSWMSLRFELLRYTDIHFAKVVRTDDSWSVAGIRVYYGDAASSEAAKASAMFELGSQNGFLSAADARIDISKHGTSLLIFPLASIGTIARVVAHLRGKGVRIRGEVEATSGP